MLLLNENAVPFWVTFPNTVCVLCMCCARAVQNNQRWKLDGGLGHIASYQAGAYPGDFLLTVCTASSSE